MIWHLLMVDGTRVDLGDEAAVAAHFAPRTVDYRPDAALGPAARGRLYVDGNAHTVAALLAGPDLDDQAVAGVLRRIRPSGEWPASPSEGQ